MNTLGTLGIAMGSAWLSGINLYAAVLALGLLQRFNMAHLPGDLNVLSEWWIIALAGALYVIQFIADKVPAVDSAWDAVHTFIRVPAGAVLAAGAFAHFEPSVRIAALLIGGGVALSSHGLKTSTRLAVNASPEPVSNIVMSVAGDVVTFGSAILMVFHPVVILVIVAISVAVTIWLVPRIFRALRRFFKRRSPQPSSAGG